MVFEWSVEPVRRESTRDDPFPEHQQPAPGATSGVHPYVTKNIRREAIEALRRFVRGEAGEGVLEAAARRLDLRSMGDLCDGLTRGDIRQVEPTAADVARQLRLYLDGCISRKAASLWFHRVYGIVTSPAFESSTAARPVAATLLGLVGALLDPDHPGAAARARRSLARVRSWLEAVPLAPPRDLLPRILAEVFRSCAPVRLATLRSPLDFSAASSGRWAGQWVDVAWRSGRDGGIRLIPFSIFTARFFRDDLPGIVTRLAQSADFAWAPNDPFCYHPENDQAIVLAERHPWLLSSPFRFHYYVDGAGLAEIVIDAPAIGRREAAFAARLFCLRSSIRCASLDGRRISAEAIRI
jgi:hypothetical protein